MPDFQPEKRKHSRIKFDGDVQIHPVMQSKSGNILEVQDKTLVGKSDDLSEGGICLEVGDTNSATEILKLTFNVQKAKTVDAYAKLAWKSGSRCGLQFIVLDDDSRKQIKDFVDKKK
jgi:c-di-GMP-binding flagellar brake protein YcgR